MARHLTVYVLLGSGDVLRAMATFIINDNIVLKTLVSLARTSPPGSSALPG
jgi:hypothetical protein